MWEILTGQFFWGIVVGLVLSFFGAYLLALFNEKLQNRYREKLIRKFSIDTVKNLQNIIDKMNDARDRTKAIYHDYLALIDIEIGVFGRNREHLIHLTENERDLTREFVNACAIKKAEVAGKLDTFYQMGNLADEIEAQGDPPKANRLRKDAIDGPLAEAHRAADALVGLANNAKTEVVPSLKALK